MLKLGDCLGAYRILEPLGQGAMGSVYLAEHTLIGRKVAIKVIVPALASNPRAVSLFFREAQAANQIAHPNIIQITDLVEGDDEAPTFMVMELLDGSSLREVLDRETRLDPLFVVAMGRQIAEAMAAAHAAAVIHRDLKPDNVFLCDRTGDVKILDFGVARLMSSPFDWGEVLVCGTPLYISPEQAGAETVDERSDVYSLGALLYESVAGRPVFDFTEVRSLLTAHIADDPEPLELEGFGASRLAALIMRCLAKSPADRPQSMGEIAAELRDIEARWEDSVDDAELDRLLDHLWDDPPRHHPHVA